MRKAGKTDAEIAATFKGLDAELEPIELMRGTEHLMNVFSRLSSARGAGMNGPLPISHAEIKAYCELMDEHLTPWEIETLRAMDVAFLTEALKIER